MRAAWAAIPLGIREGDGSAGGEEGGDKEGITDYRAGGGRRVIAFPKETAKVPKASKGSQGPGGQVSLGSRRMHVN